MNKSNFQFALATITVALLSTSAYAQEVQQKNPVSLPMQSVNSERIEADSSGQPQQPAASQNPMATPVNYRGDDALRRQAQVARNPELAGRLDSYGRPIQQQAAQTESEPEFIKKIKDQFKPEQDYTMEPGDNIMIPVGKGFINSLKTNFKSLSVKTSVDGKAAVLQVEDGNLYATIKTDAPVSLLLSEDGVLESEVSVVLVPMAAPPTMIDLTIDLTPGMLAKAERYQDKLAKEEALAEAESASHRSSRMDPYVRNLVNLLKPVAQGKLPSGFSMTDDIPKYYEHPCRIALPHSTGQRLSGGREVIDVVLIENTSERPYEVREEMCLSEDVLTVGIFPRAYLAPGQSTEVYIVRDKYHFQEKARENTRPRLVGGSQ